MNKVLLAAMLLLTGSSARSSCLPPSGAISVTKIRLGDPANVWTGCVNDSIDHLSNGAVSTGTASAISASTTSIYAALNSTAAALTVETNRAIARENAIAVSTGSTYAALNSTGAALTIETARATVAEATLTSAVNSTGSAVTTETARAIARENAIAVSTGSTYAALNSTGAALTVETARAVAAEAVLSASTASLNSIKLSSPTVAGVLGNVLTLGTGGQPAWATASSGSGGSLFSTGTLTGSATAFPLRNQGMFDSTFVNLTDSPTINATFITFKNMGGITSAPTEIDLTAVTNYPYTPPNGVSMLVVDFNGGGSGGSAIATNAGVAGTSSTWIIAGSTIAANGGNPAAGAGPAFVGGDGGTGGAGGFGIWASSSVSRSPGTSGLVCHSFAANNYAGQGGASIFGGGGPTGTTTGTNSPSFGGGGGGAGSSTSNCGAGGGGAEGVHLVIYNPVGPYYLTTGSGGLGGAAGTTAGGNGGGGKFAIHEYYGTQGFAAASSSAGVITSQTFTNTTMATCLTGSTRTWTSSGADADMILNLTVGNTSLQNTQSGYLLDGNFPAGYGAATGLVSNAVAANTGSANLSFTHRQTGISPGVHNVCVVASVGGGTGSVNGNTGSGTAQSTFEVREIRSAIGTGDVSSNGTNTLSGPFTVTGLTTLSTTTLTGYFSPRQMTLSQAVAAIPTVGAVISCSNCTNPYTLLVGTGTAVDQWREQGLTTGAK